MAMILVPVHDHASLRGQQRQELLKSEMTHNYMPKYTPNDWRGRLQAVAAAPAADSDGYAASERYCSTLSFETMAAHQSGWSRQSEDAAQCDSLCSAASTMSSLSMLLCDGRDSSVSSAATPAGASFSWERAQHGDSFGGKLNSLRSQAGQQRSHPYGKAMLVTRANSPPAMQGFDDMKSLHHHVPLSRETAAAQHDDELSMGPGNPDAFCRTKLAKNSK